MVKLDRIELYKQITKLNLKKKCVEKYGKNYTNCKTEQLQELVDEATDNFQAGVEELKNLNFVDQIKVCLHAMVELIQINEQQKQNFHLVINLINDATTIQD